MKLLRQFGIILLITFAGEICKAALPLPIPASIYGMVIMLAGLVSGVLRLEDVQNVGDFLVEIMPILFVPAAVELIDSWETMRALLIAAYVLGQWCRKKWKLTICNPLLIAVIVIIALLLIFDVDYDTYYAGAKYIGVLQTYTYAKLQDYLKQLQ